MNDELIKDMYRMMVRIRAVDGGRVLVVEVKNKLEKRMVDKFLEEKLPRFKEIFPEYAKYQVIGGMGALVVRDEVGRYAEKCRAVCADADG